MKKNIDIILNERGFTKETLAKALSLSKQDVEKIINGETIEGISQEKLESKLFHLANGFVFETPKDKLEELISRLKNQYGLTTKQLCFYADVSESEFERFMNNELIERDSKIRIYSYLASLYHILN
ncbi:HTH domain-containing protein [Companilactobacillus sp. DQM5]|uniref:HTH domain-containing protein n=1 Tax=Companilactobacillus sp. DQM5 TaxID=3463359 RepID=UPI0040590A1F